MEQESIFPEIPVGKIFKPKGIFLATFFGGPFVAGYLISANYRTLKEQNNVIKTWIFTIIGTLIILVFSYIINYRSTRHIPGYLFPVIYSTITYNVVNLVQKAKLSNYISAGGQFYSAGKLFVVTIIGLMATLIGLLVLENIYDFFLLEMPSSKS